MKKKKFPTWPSGKTWISKPTLPGIEPRGAVGGGLMQCNTNGTGPTCLCFYMLGVTFEFQGRDLGKSVSFLRLVLYL